jgi:NAD-dependent dihydropyrimidine dehydrogenase PreA subunit
VRLINLALTMGGAICAAVIWYTTVASHEDNSWPECPVNWTGWELGAGPFAIQGKDGIVTLRTKSACGARLDCVAKLAGFRICSAACPDEVYRLIALPLWMPLVSLAAWPAYLGFAAGRRWLRLRRTRRAMAEDRCVRCGYDVRFLERNRCPECGERFECRPSVESTSE